MKSKRVLCILLVILAFCCLFISCKEEPKHEHSLTHHEADSAKCIVEYWGCSCGKNFSDANGNTELASIYSHGTAKTDYAMYCSDGKLYDICTVCNGAADESTLGKTTLKNLIISDTVTSVADSAFEDFSVLETVTVPSSVTSFGSNAFDFCFALKEVNISSLEKWCTINFSSFYSNPLNSFSNNCHLKLNGTEITELVIPSTVTSISAHAFSGGREITSVSIPSSVTSIGDYAFNSCEGLKSITIPSSVTTIGSGAFCSCACLTSLTIPDTVTTLEEGIFSYCVNLEEITLPSSITSIGTQAFYYCMSLATINYNGTKEDWNSKITFGDSWNGYVSETVVHCTDGDLDL